MHEAKAPSIWRDFNNVIYSYDSLSVEAKNWRKFMKTNKGAKLGADPKKRSRSYIEKKR